MQSFFQHYVNALEVDPGTLSHLRKNYSQRKLEVVYWLDENVHLTCNRVLGYTFVDINQADIDIMYVIFDVFSSG